VLKCSPYLDATIAEMQQRCKENGKNLVILPMGKTAFKRIMGCRESDPVMKEDYINYPFWNERYGAWVVAADHPSYLMRGNHHLVSVMQFAFTRAVEIAEKGLELVLGKGYLLDPDPTSFAGWFKDFQAAYETDKTLVLSYDIETPYKQGLDEEKVDKEGDDDYTIIRCSFCYTPGNAVSVRWGAEHWPTLQQLFAHPVDKMGWNNEGFDYPRVASQTPIAGDQLDGMLAWHVLNSALPKGLGFVTPFYAQNVPMWKHLSQGEPAFYNAKDADMALRNWLGIRKNLEENGQWPVFSRHVIQVNQVFKHMSDLGVLRDEALRAQAEQSVGTALAAVEQRIDEVVPVAAKQLKVYKKTPKDTTGMIEVPSEVLVARCCKCLSESPKADHFRSKVKKVCSSCNEPWRKSHEKSCGGSASSMELNPCVAAGKCVTPETRSLWARPLPFAISNVSLQRYQRVKGHRAIIIQDRNKPPRITYDEGAMLKLMKQYKRDELYPLIPEQRGLQKLLSNYIGVTTPEGRVVGGLPVGKDGKIHTRFTHNPSTLRSASQNPNLQNLPRPKGIDDPATIIRNLVVAREGHTFYARDYSGIEAVLVGYFARLPEYIRLAKLDVHSFYTAYALNQLDGRIATSDLPEFGWPDDRLIPHLAWIKKEFKHDRNTLYKHLVHGANFMQGAKGAREKIFTETGIEYEIPLVQKVMDIYFALFPRIKDWHQELLLQASEDGYLRNPFGYVHRFYRVFDWTKEDGIWKKKPGADANKVIAFLPQSTAAGIIKEAMLRLYFEQFDSAGRYLRLLVHDELFLEVPEKEVDAVDGIVKWEMEQPIPELALPESYGMGPFLNILTEEKKGNRWGSMR
jgi:hypothetical protein